MLLNSCIKNEVLFCWQHKGITSAWSWPFQSNTETKAYSISEQDRDVRQYRDETYITDVSTESVRIQKARV